MEPLATPDLDADLDPEYVRQSAVTTQVTRAALALAVGAALLGVFGGAGPLVMTQTESDGLTVGWARFARLDAPVALAVELPPGDSAFTVTGDLADGLQLESVAPAPSAEATVPGGRRFVVDAAGGATVHARPLRFGVLRGTVALDGGQQVAVRTVVYP